MFDDLKTLEPGHGLCTLQKYDCFSQKSDDVHENLAGFLFEMIKKWFSARSLPAFHGNFTRSSTNGLALTTFADCIA